MHYFGTYFAICNVFLSLVIGALLFIKTAFKKQLSGRVQYHLWFLMFIALFVPFISFRPLRITNIFSWFSSSKVTSAHSQNILTTTTGTMPAASSEWINDFSVSVDKHLPDFINYVLLFIWITGMAVALFLLIRARVRIYYLERSALPVQNHKVVSLFEKCVAESGINSKISVYSTAFIQSPVQIGVFNPRIYLPIHLIQNLNISDMRYMLLHELQHVKHRDSLIKYLAAFGKIIYWFNPLVWYATKELHSDCEIACDTSVLKIITPNKYYEYGNTLLNFAEKTTHTSFSFTNGMGGSKLQIRKRIINIASYKPETKVDKLKNLSIYILSALLVIEIIAYYPARAAGNELYDIPATLQIETIDLSNYFSGYEGTFVFYDMNGDSWEIYNPELASTRISPNSTYKIYSAMHALENNVIQPSANTIRWDGTESAYPQWNQDQTLKTAFDYSVNWYFQELDQRSGISSLKQFYSSIEYGNQDLSGGITGYWKESSLKISPFEQVQLLKDFYTNKFCFAEENVQAVKNAMRLSLSDINTLYGKTGTGSVNGENINGWFIGYIESFDNTYFFATNVQNDYNASGSVARDITLDILKSKSLY